MLGVHGGMLIVGAGARALSVALPKSELESLPIEASLPAEKLDVNQKSQRRRIFVDARRILFQNRFNCLGAIPVGRARSTAS